LGNSSAPVTVGPTQFSARPLHTVVNILFFLSLVTSLIAALGALVIKQSMQTFTSGLKGMTSSRRLARTRYKRQEIFSKWSFEEVIAAVPMLLHLALWLFFIGLVLWLHTLNVALFWTTTSVTALALLLYVVVAFVPLMKPESPYQWPLSWLLSWVYESIKFNNSTTSLNSSQQAAPIVVWDVGKIVSTPFRQLETTAFDLARKPADPIDMDILFSVFQTADSRKEIEATFESIPRIFSNSDLKFVHIQNDKLSECVRQWRSLSGSCWDSTIINTQIPVIFGRHLHRAVILARFMEWLLQTPQGRQLQPTGDDLALAFAIQRYGDQNDEYELSILGTHLRALMVHLRITEKNTCLYLENSTSLTQMLANAGPGDLKRRKSPSSTQKEWTQEELLFHRTLTEHHVVFFLQCLIHHPQCISRDDANEEFRRIASLLSNHQESDQDYATLLPFLKMALSQIDVTHVAVEGLKLLLTFVFHENADSP
jgi:hypothetical protein